MGRINSLENCLTDIADAIRRKTKTTDTILAKEFDEAINSIQSSDKVNGKLQEFSVGNNNISKGDFVKYIEKTGGSGFKEITSVRSKYEIMEVVVDNRVGDKYNYIYSYLYSVNDGSGNKNSLLEIYKIDGDKFVDLTLKKEIIFNTDEDIHSATGFMIDNKLIFFTRGFSSNELKYIVLDIDNNMNIQNTPIFKSISNLESFDSFNIIPIDKGNNKKQFLLNYCIGDWESPSNSHCGCTILTYNPSSQTIESGTNFLLPVDEYTNGIILSNAVLVTGNKYIMSYTNINSVAASGNTYIKEYVFFDINNDDSITFHPVTYNNQFSNAIWKYSGSTIIVDNQRNQILHLYTVASSMSTGYEKIVISKWNYNVEDYSLSNESLIDVYRTSTTKYNIGKTYDYNSDCEDILILFQDNKVSYAYTLHFDSGEKPVFTKKTRIYTMPDNIVTWEGVRSDLPIIYKTLNTDFDILSGIIIDKTYVTRTSTEESINVYTYHPSTFFSLSSKLMSKIGVEKITSTDDEIFGIANEDAENKTSIQVYRPNL